MKLPFVGFTEVTQDDELLELELLELELLELELELLELELLELELLELELLELELLELELELLEPLATVLRLSGEDPPGVPDTTSLHAMRAPIPASDAPDKSSRNSRRPPAPFASRSIGDWSVDPLISPGGLISPFRLPALSIAIFATLQ